MFPGMGGRGMNPKKVAAMMRQMGIEMEDIDDVEEVIIRTADKEIYFTDAAVSKMTARGEVTWQVMGTDKVRPRTDKAAAPAAAPAPVKLEVKEEDVDLVASQANVSKEQARKALEAANGEPAEALLKLLGDDA